MQFIPRSHDRGHLKFRQADGQSVLSRETVGAETMGDPISNDLAAGHFSMHADMLVHGSRPNASDRRRCGLTIRYCPPEVKVTDANWAGSVEAIVCRGTAAGSWWTHHPRPENDDIAGLDRPTSIGGN